MVKIWIKKIEDEKRNFLTLQKRINIFKKSYKNNPNAMELIKQEEQEIAMFKKYNSWYGSVFYIMQI